MMRGIVALNLRRLLAHPVRFFLTVATLAVAAALVVSTAGLVGSTSRSLDRSAEALTGTAEIEVAAISDGGFDAALAAEVAAVEGVAVAAPVVRASVFVDGERAVLVGLDASAEALLPSGDDLQVSEVQAGDLAVAAPLADRLDVGPGDSVAVAAAGGRHDVTVAAVVSGRPVDALNAGFTAAASIPVAQLLTGRPNRLDSILVRSAEGTDVDAVRQRIGEVVGGRAAVVDPGGALEGSGTALEAVNQALGAMAALALLVAGFVVFNTMSMNALERRKELAVLRAVGARRRALVGRFLVEAGVVGLVGAVAGSVLGAVGGRALLDRLPAGVRSTVGTELTFTLPGWAVPVAVVGAVATAMLASLAPALRASSVPPAEALRPHEVVASEGRERGSSRWLLVGGAGAVVVGAALAALGGSDLFMAATTLVLAGALAATYGGTRQLTAVGGRIAGLFRGPGRLAADSLTRAPGRMWATVATVLLGVASTLAIGQTASNLRTAASATFEPLDDLALLVQPVDVDELPVSVDLAADLEAAIAAVPGVAGTIPGRFSFAYVDGERWMIQAAGPRSRTALLGLAGEAARAELATSDAVVLSTTLADRLELEPGDRLALPTAVGVRDVIVAGVAPSFLWPTGVVGIDYQRYLSWFGGSAPTYIEVELAPGADRAAVATAIGALPTSTPLNVFDGSEVRRAGERNIEQVQALLLGFQWIIVLAAALAILNTLLISLIERRRELAMMRAIGMSRRSLMGMVIAETAAIVGIGAAIGVAIGMLQHRVLVELSESSGFPARYAFELVPALVALVAASAMAFLGAALPARRASRSNIVEAIGYE